MILNTVVDRCESTNDIARQFGEEGAPHGSWISARIQDRGRGRLGRQWESKEGNLFLSLIARLEHRQLWTWIPLVTAIGAATALREKKFPVQIKWPNDLWIDQKKLGGILCEAVGNSRESFVVIGLGLNCAHAPEGLDQPTTSLSLAKNKGIVADDIRAEIVEGILRALDQLQGEGIPAMGERYAKLAALQRGALITWGEGHQGTVEGLGESGELIVQVKGERRKLFAEDVKIKVLPTKVGEFLL